jgi:hypothetical protein
MRDLTADERTEGGDGTPLTLECGAVTIHFLMQELTRPPTLGVELGLS